MTLPTDAPGPAGDAVAQRPVVRAAGGAVWRQRADGIEVLVVHRPRYDDWTLPKGKAEPGEADLDAARREVAEETGLDCDIGPELPTIRYIDHNGRPKVVRYWVMTAREDAGDFMPNREVDEIAWLPLAEASTRLTYDRDRPLLDALASSL